uniref:Band 3 anion exchange protein-like n=2 Tax=Sinocyclocheilus rhinocerous TaxID=307959 RepID=A0A673HCT4_9TELE
MSYEDSESSLPSPFTLTPAGHKGSYDLEQMRQQEEEQHQTFTFSRDLEAARNTNTNAIKRGDAEAYVELNELRGEVWQEMGRWLGYEENLSPATGQWSQPHISYLTFKSLIQLRKVMTTGAVLLDVDESSLSSICQKMVEQLLLKKEIRPTDRDALVAILQRKRSQLEPTSAPGSADIELQTFSITKQRDMVDRVEASVVLSGVVENLQKPVVAFARLRDSVVMEGVLEAPIPVRFVFFHVGPSHSGMDYHESGRAMASLMADWVFTLEAYLATNEKDLTNAMADFMDCSIVIPPTEIQDESMLKPIINFQKKMLRDRVRPYDTRLMVGGKAPTGPEKPREDPLARTGYPFGGMVKDIKRCYKRYLSDFTDALDPQVLSAVIFIYFAALSPAITFGGLLECFTRKWKLIPEIIERAYPNTALLSMCLMFGCFFIALYIRGFKTSTFLPGPIRRMIGDFGVPIAIFFMIAVDIIIRDAYTQKLVVPKGLTVSNPSARGWIISPFGEKKPFPVWMMFACVVPGLLVFILIFLESQITTLIVSKPERKMVKGSGFHLDLLLLVFLGGVASVFGVPWLSAATVRSVTHANALTVMTKGPRPQIEHVLEQRVSGILVAVMIGVSILMEPILKMIPMTALFGIFLYMGITSLSGIQLWDRMLLLITPKKHHPPVPFVTRVPTMRMHLYTLIQVICLAILWAIKSSAFSLALPFVLILTIPLRMFMTGPVFTIMEMKCLDADDANVKFDDEDD